MMLNQLNDSIHQQKIIRTLKIKPKLDYRSDALFRIDSILKNVLISFCKGKLPINAQQQFLKGNRKDFPRTIIFSRQVQNKPSGKKEPILKFERQKEYQMSKTQQGSIGTIIAFWNKPLGTLMCTKSGTAFALTSNIILTCTHNIYSERRSEFCSFVLFYPNPDRSAYLNSLQSYPSQPGQFYQCLEVTQTLRTKPIKQEICLIALKNDLPITNTIRLGTISQTNHTIGKQLTVSGYPCANCRMENDLSKVRADRVTLSGKILAFEGDIINYQIQTSIGHSGSPLLYKDQKGSYMAIGIHTHRGLRPEYNSGLFFSTEILGMIQSFCSSLSQRYGLSTKINYACDKQTLKNYKKKVECSHNVQNIDVNDLEFELASNSESSYSNESQQSQFQDLESKYELYSSTSEPKHNLEASNQHQPIFGLSPKLQSLEMGQLIDSIVKNQQNREQNNGSHFGKAQDCAIQNDKSILKIPPRHLNIEIETSKAQTEDQRQIRQFIGKNMFQQQQDLQQEDLRVAKNEPRAQSYL